MADLSFNEEKARQWEIDVLHEIDLVNEELAKVNTESEIVPGEDDTIFQGILRCNEEMQNGWNRLLEGFRSATEKVGNAINKIIETIGKARDDVDALTTRMK